MRKQINKVKNWKQFYNENYSKVNNDLVQVGDIVSYEKETSGSDIVNGYRMSKKKLEVGTIISRIPSINNLSPKFIIKNENGDTDEVMVGSVIEILKNGK